MPGPGKKPRQLKVISGTVQPCRDIPAVELPVISDIPEPPVWLKTRRGLEEWARLAPILTANKLLTEGGLSAFGLLCALHGTITDLYATGGTPSGEMIGKYRTLVNDFGLTPAAQGRVKQFGQETPTNRFAKFKKQAA